jgi:hypothetical protein
MIHSIKGRIIIDHIIIHFVFGVKEMHVWQGPDRAINEEMCIQKQKKNIKYEGTII